MKFFSFQGIVCGRSVCIFIVIVCKDFSSLFLEQTVRYIGSCVPKHMQIVYLWLNESILLFIAFLNSVLM